MRKSHVSARMKYVSFDESACFVSRYEKPPLDQMEIFLFIQKNINHSGQKGRSAFWARLNAAMKKFQKQQSVSGI
jgi:hypothetical protein